MGTTRIQRSAVALSLALGAFACSIDDEPTGGQAGRLGDASGARSSDGSGNAGDGSGPGPTAADGTRYVGTFPIFPGAGTSDEAEPLDNGMICDSRPAEHLLIPESLRECFFGKDDPSHQRPAATLEQVLECAPEGDTIHIRLTFHPWFVDNTYGASQIGWAEEEPERVSMPMEMRKPKRGRGHSFRDLVGSDHAEILVTDGAGGVSLHFKLDYVSEDDSAPSGYASLGVAGGDGKMIVGDAGAIVRWMTSIDRNLNERGFASYTIDSPATDEHYTPNDATPEWDYRVVYEVWIDAEVFGSRGFGGATIEFVHASPSKADSNTIEVEPGECPPPPPCPDSDPDASCDQGGGGTGGSGDEDPCLDRDPDTWCGDAGPPDGDEPPLCEVFPHDPSCVVD